MTFRTPEEAVKFANNTRYGLAASIWSKNVNLALDIATQAQGWRRLDQLHQSLRRRFRLWRLSRIGLRPRGRPRGHVRVSGPGRREGRGRMRSVGGKLFRRCRREASRERARCLPAIDRTAKLYVGGKQARPDSGYSYAVLDATGVRSARPGSATARTSATRSRRPPRRAGGAPRPRTTGRRCSTTSPRTSPPARRVRRAPRRH